MIPIYLSPVSCVMLSRIGDHSKLLLLRLSPRDSGHWSHISGTIEQNET